MRRQGLAILGAIAIFVTAGCTATGEDRAREMAAADAKKIARQLEVAARGRPDVGPKSIDYLRSIVKPPDMVLDSWSEPGYATDLAGWADVALTRTSTNDVFSSGAQATMCFRFEVRWSDTHGAQFPYQEKRCPNGVPTATG